MSSVRRPLLVEDGHNRVAAAQVWRPDPDRRERRRARPARRGLGPAGRHWPRCSPAATHCARPGLGGGSAISPTRTGSTRPRIRRDPADLRSLARRPPVPRPGGTVHSPARRVGHARAGHGGRGEPPGDRPGGRRDRLRRPRPALARVPRGRVRGAARLRPRQPRPRRRLGRARLGGPRTARFGGGDPPRRDRRRRPRVAGGRPAAIAAGRTWRGGRRSGWRSAGLDRAWAGGPSRWS